MLRLRHITVSVIAFQLSLPFNGDHHFVEQKWDVASVLPTIATAGYHRQVLFRHGPTLPRPRNHEFKEITVPIGGASIRYIETGMIDYQPILLLHGATFRAELWKNLGIMRHLANMGYRVISADLPRHGKSGNPATNAENFLHEFVSKVGLLNPIIIGHSYAGTYILPFLSNHADVIEAVVLVAPTSIKLYLKSLKNVSTPTLIVWGDQDEMIPVHQAYLLHRTIPGSRRIILKGAQHECYNSHPDEFKAAITQFILDVRKVK